MSSLLEVIEFFDQSRRSVLQRIPPHGSIGIQLGSQLIVQQHQEAVFWTGKPCDVFGPGRHSVSPTSLPVMMREISTAWQEDPPRTPVYFVGTQPFTDQKWSAEVDFPDEINGIVRLRAAGKFSFQVVDAREFLSSFNDDCEPVTSSDALNLVLRPVVAQLVAKALLASCSHLNQLSAKLPEITSIAQRDIEESLARKGVELLDFYVSTVTLPDQIRTAIKAATDGYDLVDFLRQSYSTQASVEGDPRTVVKAAVGKAGWALDDSGPEWVVVVPIDALRKQKVTIGFDRTDPAGHAIVHFSSTCGPVHEQEAIMFLRFNSQMDYGAFAIKPTDAGEMLVVEMKQLAHAMDELGAARTLGAIAWQADQMEEKLMLVDTF